MKFLALRDAFEACEKQRPKPAVISPAVAIPAPPPFYRPDRSPERVVGSTHILWKPVDRVAARVIAKAPWWAKPPANEPIKASQSPVNQKTKRIIMPMRRNDRERPNYTDNRDHVITDVVDNLHGDSMTEHLISSTQNNLEKTFLDTQKLHDRAIDLRAALDEMSNSWKESWVEFIKTGDDRLKELRQLRMSTELEMKHIMGGFREVRSFFLDKDFESERARLQEFVSLCERLKQLKDSGFLDTVADTILKLHVA